MTKGATKDWAGLRYSVFDHVALAPTVGEQDGRLMGGFAEPDSVPAVLRHQRQGRSADQAVADFPEAPRILEGNYLYGGPLIGHFGHFIAECVHRLWLASHPDFKGVPLLFLAAEGDAVSPALAAKILPVLGVEAYSIVHEPVQVERLVVGEMGKSMRTPASQPYLDWLAKHRPLDSFRDHSFPDKISMMRGHLLGGKILGEPALEAWLEEEGYTAVRPEDHDLATQLKFVVNAKKLVFSEGSAIHLADLLPSIRADVAVLLRRPFSRLVPTSLEGKCRSLSVFSDVTPALLPGDHIKGGRFDKNLVYAPLDDVAEMLRAAGFVQASPEPALTARGAYLQGLLHYSNAVAHRLRDGTHMARPEKVERMLADVLDALGRKDKRYRKERYLRFVAEARLAVLEGREEDALELLEEAISLNPAAGEAQSLFEELSRRKDNQANDTAPP